MLKGSAEIELRDERTGETTYVKHENMLTDGLSIALTPQTGRYTYPTGYQGGSGAPETDEQKMNHNRSVMDHLLGGVFLFGETLQESAGNLEMPLGALIGKGAHNAYSGVDTKRGSYNGKESGLQPDGSYRHVWDFATSQANGTIRALALTTHAGGIEGDGTREWNSAQTAESAPLYHMLNAGSSSYGAYLKYPAGMSGSCFLFASFQKNRIYAVKDRYEITYNTSGDNPDRYFQNSRKLHVMEYGFPLSGISPFYDGYNLYRVQEHEIEVPEEYVSHFTSVQGNLYTCVGGSHVQERNELPERGGDKNTEACKRHPGGRRGFLPERDRHKPDFFRRHELYSGKPVADGHPCLHNGSGNGGQCLPQLCVQDKPFGRHGRGEGGAQGQGR